MDSVGPSFGTWELPAVDRYLDRSSSVRLDKLDCPDPVLDVKRSIANVRPR